MARIYTSRQLLDPSLISMANQAMQNRLTQDSARRKNVIDAWSNVGTTAGSAFDKYMDAKRAEDEQKKRFGSVYLRSSEEDRRDPLFRAALDEYSRTGSSSPLSNLIMQRDAAAAREASAEQARQDRLDKEKRDEEVRREAEAERKRKEQEVENRRIADAEMKMNELIAKGVSAAESGNYDSAALYLNNAKKLAEVNGLTYDDTDYVENAKKTAAAKAQSRRYRSELENYLLAGFETDADILDFKQRVSNARDDGLINDDDANDLYQMASSAKSNKSKYREGAVNTGVGINNEAIRQNAEDLKAAKKAWEKLQRGEAILGEDERIFLKIYGKDPVKKKRYDEING